MIVGYDARVPLLDGREVQYINFDNAASTPVLKPVLDKVNEFLYWYSNIHRGTGFKSQLASEMYDRAREIVARFVGVDLASHTIIFGKNATEAINKLAHRLPLSPDQVILVSKMEHHSNDLPWRARGRVIHIDIDEKGRLREEDLIARLEEYRGRVALFAVTGASNVSGWVNDIHRLAEICHHYGTRILVDGAQLIPHRAVNMRPQDDPGHIDFLAFSAHKIYAPFGTGVLIGDKEVFAQGDPDYVGGGTVDIVTLDYTYWTDVPEKEEAGTPNVVGVIALAKALLVMQELGMDHVAAHEERLTRYALERLKEVPELTIYGSDDPGDVANRLGVISFNVNGLPNNLVAAILNYEGGIGVRNGCFCAHPYIKCLLHISQEDSRRLEQQILQHDRSQLPGAVRVSFGIYNDESEIDVLVDLLKRIAARQWQGDYVVDRWSGEYHPRGFSIDYDQYFTF
ncbi:MAG: aminotransferase class V-fold PLP-dependent enzyme [Calditrichaeota bacterium]|nr:MAG: aminotransferase class V-fold PLP-dependent enzyme [Calditrichota bacterium]